MSYSFHTLNVDEICFTSKPLIDNRIEKVPVNYPPTYNQNKKKKNYLLLKPNFCLRLNKSNHTSNAVKPQLTTSPLSQAVVMDLRGISNNSGEN